ncbi:MAG TPA: translation initiation factor IF-3 [Pyrinomonadaceae bacterium]|nr:translation initiation factor IF-3 [Pyrinomonadaceae bacterium]
MARRFGGRNFRPRQREPLHRTNERIRVPAVRVVTDDGETLGVMDTRDAIQEARKRGVDLVEIAANAKPPVCKLIDYGKFLYEQKKRAHEAKKKQVTVQVKEIKFRPGTDDHDYGYRMKHAREWLEDGDKVRAAIAFRGREMSHRELGAKILAKLTQDLADLADVEVAPKMEGYQMFTIFNPKKSKVADKKTSNEKLHQTDEPMKEKQARSEKDEKDEDLEPIDGIF